MTVLPTAYFPPISYLSLLAGGGVVLEGQENYIKQTWRNRCSILTSNGVENLQVPVVHLHDGSKQPIASVKVDYSRNWAVRHERALDSAYKSAAYYDYYRDELFSILDAHTETLWNLNIRALEFLVRHFHIEMPGITENYTGATLQISPKCPDPVYVERPYFQVFGEKFGFTPNLSSLDLLFNEGPDATSYLLTV